MNGFYYLNDQNKTQGPVSLNDLISLMVAGRIQSTTLVARSGDAAWLPLTTVIAVCDVVRPSVCVQTAIIGIGSLISVFALSQLGFFVPIVLTAAYAFLSIRMDDTSILDFLRYAVRYFLLQQQSYSWGMTKTIQNQR